METSHPFTRRPWGILETMPKVGIVERPFVEYRDQNPFFLEVTKRVKEYFDKTGLDPKDPIPSLKVFAFLLFCWVTGYYLASKYAIVWGAILLGVTRALLGINTMHASSHFAVSHKPWVWYWLDWFCFDILMGGSSLAWNYQHVIGHHQHTNVFRADPDLPIITEGDMRRVFSIQKWKGLYRFQAYYLPLLYCLLAFKTRYYDILFIFGYSMNGNLKMNAQFSDRLMQLLTKLFFVCYQFLIPFYYFHLPLRTVMWMYAVADIASGAWLAYFFQVNHISDTLEYTEQEQEHTTLKKEWAQLQLEGTLDYAHDSPLFTFFEWDTEFSSSSSSLPINRASSLS